MLSNQITIKDIAKLLGISKSTVSRALKNHPDIRQETKDAVMQVAKGLNYRPNTVALSLRNRKSKIIGLIVPKISYFFFPSIVDGIEDEVHKHGYEIMILQSNESYEREVEACDILISNNVEGILASVAGNTDNYSHFEDIIKSKTPVVFFDRVPEKVKADMVLVDDVEGAYRATKHLINLGRKRIAICTGNKNLLICRNRLNGYKKALIDSNLSFVSKYIIYCESPEEAENETNRLLNEIDPPDGIFAISDLTMSGIMKALYCNNIRIPKDVAVIGFCEEPFGSLYNPPISTIKPMGFEIGKTAAKMLFDRIKGIKTETDEPIRIDLKSEMIIRTSTVDSEVA